MQFLQKLFYIKICLNFSQDILKYLYDIGCKLLSRASNHVTLPSIRNIILIGKLTQWKILRKGSISILLISLSLRKYKQTSFQGGHLRTKDTRPVDTLQVQEPQCVFPVFVFLHCKNKMQCKNRDTCILKMRTAKIWS